MFEAVVAIVVFSALVLAGGRQSQTRSPTLSLVDSDDLPCPWCRSATLETDEYCVGCGQPFGTTTQRSTRSNPNPSER